MRRTLAWCGLLGLCACFSEPESVTSASSTPGDGSTSSTSSADTSGMTESMPEDSSSSVGGSTFADSGSSGALCEEIESDIGLLDADVVLAIDPSIPDLPWDELVGLLSAWEDNNVNYAVLINVLETAQLTTAFQCEAGCGPPCPQMANTVRVPYDVGDAIDALNNPSSYSCALRPDPGGGGPTRHVWLWSANPSRDVTMLPDVGQARFHVSCHGCDDTKTLSPSLAALVDDSLGRVSDLGNDDAVAQHAVSIGSSRYACGWFSDSAPEGGFHVIELLNEAIAVLNDGDGVVLDEVAGLGDCSEAAEDPKSIDELALEFFRIANENLTVLCPTSCVLMQLEPAQNTQVAEFHCGG